MKVAEALPILQAASGRPFGELFAGHPEDLRTNKGHVGQLLMRYLGLQLDSQLLDFEDGELKTNRTYPNGKPKETMWIHQVAKDIDTLVGPGRVQFADSQLYHKIKNLIYLPVVKESARAADWYFIKCIHVEVERSSLLYVKLDEDYSFICKGLEMAIKSGKDGNIHTTNGKYYLQVRSKDSKSKGNYHPIYSKTFKRLVSNKNFGFYFMKQFMLDAEAGRLEIGET